VCSHLDEWADSITPFDSEGGGVMGGGIWGARGGEKGEEERILSPSQH